MDLPRVRALARYWKDMPPVHIEIARIGAAFGVPRPSDSEASSSSKPSKPEEYADPMELFSMFPVAE